MNNICNWLVISVLSLTIAGLACKSDDGSDDGDDREAEASQEDRDDRASSSGAGDDVWVSEAQFCRFELREDGDDEAKIEATVTYDDDGRLEALEMEGLDSEMPKMTGRRIEFFEYDGDMVKTRQFFTQLEGEQADEPRAGELHLVEGKNLAWGRDENSDGELEETVLAAYSGTPAHILAGGAGFIIEPDKSEAEEAYDFTHDDDGLVTRVELKEDADIAPNIPGTAEFTYTDDGFFDEIVVETRDGDVTQRQTHDYNDDGHIERVKQIHALPDDEEKVFVIDFEYDC